MKLKELDVLEFLPQYMRHDKTAQGIAYATTKIFNEYVINNIEKCGIYYRIDKLDEKMLDKLAWQFNVPEYIPTLSLSTKRNIIKNCIETHRQRGTVAAVEKVVESVFGNGYVEEWFDYNGEPYHFKVHTSNVSANDSMIEEFENIVASTQNVRSVLEAIVVETVLEMNTYQSGKIHTTERIYI